MDSEPDTAAADPFAPLAAAYAHLPDAAVVWSPEGEIVLWNKAAEDLLGYIFKEARSKDISFLAPPEDSGDTIKLFSRALSGQLELVNPATGEVIQRLPRDDLQEALGALMSRDSDPEARGRFDVSV